MAMLVEFAINIPDYCPFPINFNLSSTLHLFQFEELSLSWPSIYVDRKRAFKSCVHDIRNRFEMSEDSRMEKELTNRIGPLTELYKCDFFSPTSQSDF